MSRRKQNTVLAALDAEIAEGERIHEGILRQASEALAVLDALRAVRSRITAPTSTEAEPATPRAARGSIEKAILGKLAGGYSFTAEQLQMATGTHAASLRKALAIEYIGPPW